MKTCLICQQDKPLDDFHPAPSRKDGRMPYCRLCDNERKRKWKQENPERHKAWRKEYMKEWRKKNPDKVKAQDRRVDLKRKYGLTVDQYDAILRKQGGVCAICGEHEGSVTMPVDHNHETGAVRGILCGPCNRGLGQFKDDPERLKKALRYLRRT